MCFELYNQEENIKLYLNTWILYTIISNYLNKSNFKALEKIKLKTKRVQKVKRKIVTSRINEKNNKTSL